MLQHIYYASSFAYKVSPNDVRQSIQYVLCAQVMHVKKLYVNYIFAVFFSILSFILCTKSRLLMIRCYRKPFLFIWFHIQSIPFVSYQTAFFRHFCFCFSIVPNCIKLRQTIENRNNGEIETRMWSWYGKVHPWIFLFYVLVNKLFIKEMVQYADPDPTGPWEIHKVKS